MAKSPPTQQAVLDAIKRVGEVLGHSPSQREFKSHAEISLFHVLTHFPSWPDAIRSAGLEPNTTNLKLDPEVLLKDWGEIVRKRRQIPTQDQYRREGTYSVSSYKKFGPWSAVPTKFRDFALNKPEWADVLALLPQVLPKCATGEPSQPIEASLSRVSTDGFSGKRHLKLDDRSVYGNPIDFRGLRHEPVNEQGVVFLFGMIAREMGYLVEAIQTGYPDCEAKRQVAPGKWQKVRIEFEFESWNFDHPPNGCDVIICWRHNWPDCPKHLEVIELWREIKTLAKSED